MEPSCLQQDMAVPTVANCADENVGDRGHNDEDIYVVVVASRSTQVCEVCVGATRSQTCTCNQRMDSVVWGLTARNTAGRVIGYGVKMTKEVAFLIAQGATNVSVDMTIGGVVGGVSGAISGAISGLFWTSILLVRKSVSATFSLASWLTRQGIEAMKGPGNSSILSIPGNNIDGSAVEIRILNVDSTALMDENNPSSAQSSHRNRCLEQNSVSCQTDMVGMRPKDENPQSFVQYLCVPMGSNRVTVQDMTPLEDRTTKHLQTRDTKPSPTDTKSQNKAGNDIPQPSAPPLSH
eukprot:gene1962-7984_t